jgi:hypothetical protein
VNVYLKWRSSLLWRGLLVCSLCCIPSIEILAQNIEAIGKEKPLSISGGVALNQIFYAVDGMESRRDPYTYYASGNINVSLYGWSIPLSFSFSNQNFAFQQPFNQYSLHPTYKWVTAHLGYTSMSFSPYTVNGHIFLGAGVDVAPEGKWKISGLYGRFLKAVQPDSTNENATAPTFQRMGYGVKASYGSGANGIDIIMFHAADDVNSIQYVPEEDGILPEENLVMSIAGSKSLFNSFLAKAELATTALTRDVRSEESTHDHPYSKTGIFNARIASSYYNAFKTSLNYQQQGYTVGVGYERIDPGYRTLGSYYFNNDLENITANGAVAMFQGKVNLAANAGMQRDNLDKSKISTMRRAVGSLNVAYAPSQSVNLGMSYSNFQTYTNIRSQFVDINQLTPYDNLDTLNFTQISQNATLTGMYMFGKNQNKRQNVNVNLTFQDASDRQGEVKQHSGVQFYNINTAYGLSIVPQQMMISISFNATLNQGAEISSKTLGPTASVSKTFFDKKLRGTLSTSYNNAYTNSQRVNSIINGRVNGTLTLQKKHNINLSVVVVNRDNKVEGAAQSFTEYTGTLGYSYSFSK